MKILHAQQPFKAEIKLPPFATVMLFDADEMRTVEVLVGVLMAMTTDPKFRSALIQVYNQVRRPTDRKEIN